MVDHLGRAVAHDMQRFTGLALLAIAGLLFALFRRVAAVILPLLVVILSLVATLALMGVMGTPISLPTQILPSFLLAVGVGDSVHVLAIFYQRLRAGDDKEQAVAGALAHSGLAITVTSLTTAGGLFSFLTAQIAPVADLGVFGPVGVMMALVFTILLLPSLIAVFPMRAPREARSGRPAFTQRVLVRIGEFSARHAVAVLLVWTGITALSVFGALQVRFAHDPMSWFPKDDPFRVANEFVNERLNGTMFLEVVVDTGRENGLHDPELLHRLDELRRFAMGFQKGEVFVGKTVSPADVLKEIHQALNENRREFYAIPDDRELIAQEFLLFESAGSDDLEKLVDSRFSQGRMTLKFPFLDAIQYGPYLDVLEARFREVLGDRAEPHFTGLLMMAGRTIEAVIYSLAASYVTSFLVIAPLMILMIGSIRLGLLSMLPNLVPVVVTLGLMGWLGMPLDAFTLLIGSIALGLAVDDTTHFLHGFRAYLRGDRRRGARRPRDARHHRSGDALHIPGARERVLRVHVRFHGQPVQFRAAQRLHDPGRLRRGGLPHAGAAHAVREAEPGAGPGRGSRHGADPAPACGSRSPPGTPAPSLPRAGRSWKGWTPATTGIGRCRTWRCC